MYDILREMDWVVALRSHSLTLIFRAVTTLGSNAFALLFLALGLWLGRRATFARLIVVCAFSEILNAHLKSAYMAPRPDAAYRLVDVAGWSFPSGHAQHGTVMWLWLAWELGRPGAWIACALLSISIAVSRVYLGVHYGRDILAGSILGLAMIAYFRWLFDHRPRDTNYPEKPIVLGLFIVIQVVWLLLTPAEARALAFLPSVIYIGFLLGDTLRRRFPALRELRLGWAVLATAVVFGVGLFTELRGGRAWIGPLGLGTHPVPVYFQFTLLGVWMGLIAPNVFKKLDLSLRSG